MTIGLRDAALLEFVTSDSYRIHCMIARREHSAGRLGTGPRSEFS
jgi:hypothetical protein